MTMANHRGRPQGIILQNQVLQPTKADRYTLHELAIARMAVRAERCGAMTAKGINGVLHAVCDRLGTTRHTTHDRVLALLDELIDARKAIMDADHTP